VKLNLKDWPLIVFTVLVQTAVGSFIFLFGLLVINRRHLGQFGSTWLFSWLFRPALDLLLLMGLSLLISLFHLGRPSSAYLAVVNLKTSWLSREILAACLFFAGLLVLTISIFFWPAAHHSSVNILSGHAGRAGFNFYHVKNLPPARRPGLE